MSTLRLSSIYIAAAVAMLPLSAADASGTAAAPRPAAVAAATTGGTPSAEETLAVRNRANQLTVNGQWSQARRQWARVARMQRARGELPVEAAWAQAEISHWLGYDVDAASVLRQLGEEAQENGNFELGAQALLEAAVLYQRVELGAEARECMEQVVRLLQTPSFDAYRRDALESRIVRG